MTTTQKFWEWQEIWAKFKSENDVEDNDDFVDEPEAKEWANEAINRAEGQLHKLNEDYFLNRDVIDLENGTEEYDLPVDIYAMKIRHIRYKNTSTKVTYEIKREMNWKKFQEYQNRAFDSSSNTRYRYFLINGTPGAPQILLSPPAYEDGEVVTIWYLRNANRLVDSDDVCDIPEFIQYIFDYMNERLAFKEGARSPKHIAALEKLVGTEADMLATLADMVPDNENLIPADFSLYRSHS